jgi:hypothetical protein
MKAEICAGRIFLVPDLDPGVAIAAIDDGIGDQLLVLFDLGVGGAAADQALDGENGVRGVGDGLTLGGLADQTLAVGEADDRGRGARAFAFSMTLGWLPSMMATQLLVVPRSMPMTLDMSITFLAAIFRVAGPIRPPKPNPLIDPGQNPVGDPSGVLGLYRKGSGGLQAELPAENRPDCAPKRAARAMRRPALSARPTS